MLGERANRGIGKQIHHRDRQVEKQIGVCVGVGVRVGVLVATGVAPSGYATWAPALSVELWPGLQQLAFMSAPLSLT